MHDKIYDELVPQLAHAYQQVRIGDPLKKNVLMGPLIDAAAVDAHEYAIARAVAAGGNVLCGGKTLKGENVAWCVMQGVTDEMEDVLPVLVTRNAQVSVLDGVLSSGSHDMSQDKNEVKMGKATLELRR